MLIVEKMGIQLCRIIFVADHVRLKSFDYSSAAAYFAAICTENKDDISGHIENGEMKLNELGRVVKKELLR